MKKFTCLRANHMVTFFQKMNILLHLFALICMQPLALGFFSTYRSSTGLNGVKNPSNQGQPMQETSAYQRFQLKLKSMRLKKGELSSTILDESTARKAAFLAELAVSAYDSDEEQTLRAIHNGKCGTLKLIEVHTGPNNLRYVVYAIAKVAYVAIEGTKSIEQWAHYNFRVSVKECQITDDCGMVSDGFQTAFMHIWPSLISTLKKFKRVVVTGHSLGAAIATLVSFALAEEKKGPSIVALYTFASPRVGDEKFVESMRRSLSSVDVRQFVLESKGYLTFLPRKTRELAEQKLKQYFDKISHEKFAERTETVMKRIMNFINNIINRSGKFISSDTKMRIKETVGLLDGADKELFSIPRGLLNDIAEALFSTKKDLVTAVPSIGGYKNLADPIRVPCVGKCNSFTSLHSIFTYLDSLLKLPQQPDQCSKF